MTQAAYKHSNQPTEVQLVKYKLFEIQPAETCISANCSLQSLQQPTIQKPQPRDSEHATQCAVLGPLSDQ